MINYTKYKEVLLTTPTSPQHFAGVLAVASISLILFNFCYHEGMYAHTKKLASKKLNFSEIRIRFMTSYEEYAPYKHDKKYMNKLKEDPKDEKKYIRRLSKGKGLEAALTIIAWVLFLLKKSKIKLSATIFFMAFNLAIGNLITTVGFSLCYWRLCPLEPKCDFSSFYLKPTVFVPIFILFQLFIIFILYFSVITLNETVATKISKDVEKPKHFYFFFGECFSFQIQTLFVVTSILVIGVCYGITVNKLAGADSSWYLLACIFLLAKVVLFFIASYGLCKKLSFYLKFSLLLEAPSFFLIALVFIFYYDSYEYYRHVTQNYYSSLKTKYCYCLSDSIMLFLTELLLFRSILLCYKQQMSYNASMNPAEESLTKEKTKFVVIM